jgi:hypothetical protein
MGTFIQVIQGGGGLNFPFRPGFLIQLVMEFHAGYVTLPLNHKTAF